MNKNLKKLREIIENSEWHLDCENVIKCVSKYSTKTVIEICKNTLMPPYSSFVVHLIEDEHCIHTFGIDNDEKDAQQKACYNVINKIFNNIEQTETERFLKSF